MVTVVEAAKCPKCGILGRMVKSHKTIADGGERCDIATYHCVNEGCNWYNTGWFVQSDENGNVYEREQGERGQDKTFRPMSSEAIARGRRVVEDLMGRDLRDEDR